MLLTIFAWLLVGGFAGVLATRLRLGTNAGVVGNILAGVIGSLVAGIVTVAMLANVPDGLDIPSVIIAFVAALILLWMLHALDLGERNAHRI